MPSLKTPTIFPCSAKMFLINELSFFYYFNAIKLQIPKMNDNDIVRVFLFANIGSTTDMNLWIIKSTFHFIKNSMRLNEPFFYLGLIFFHLLYECFNVTYLLLRFNLLKV